MFFEPKKGYRLIRGDVPDGDYTVPIGTAKITREGRDVTVYAYGMMHYYALQAAQTVAQQNGIECEVVDIRTLVPLDKEMVLDSFKKTGKALIVYEDNRFLGYGAEIAAILSDEAFEYMDAPIRRLTGLDVPAVPFAHSMQDFFMPGPEKIADAVRDLAAY
jgi:2-oxoisovalerate dehydrogenase E1 component beta subunit